MMKIVKPVTVVEHVNSHMIDITSLQLVSRDGRCAVVSIWGVPTFTAFFTWAPLGTMLCESLYTCIPTRTCKLLLEQFTQPAQV